MKGYKVMCSIECRDYNGECDYFTEEYTGVVYTSREEARKEFMQAKADINISSAYIVSVEM